MPLKKGTSKKTVSSNIKELMGSYKKKGKIGTSKPASKKKAQKQAVAIALSHKKREEDEETFDKLASSVLQRQYTEYDKNELKYTHL